MAYFGGSKPGRKCVQPAEKKATTPGSKNPNAKLDECDVLHICALLAERDELRKKAAELSAHRIAEKFGVSVVTINQIASGRIWRHV